MNLYPKKNDILTALDDTLYYTQKNTVPTILFAVAAFLTLISGFAVVFVDVFWLVILTVDVFLVITLGSRKHISFFKSTLLSYSKKLFAFITVFQIVFIFLYFYHSTDASVELSHPQSEFQTSDNNHSAEDDTIASQISSKSSEESTSIFAYIWEGALQGAGDFSIVLLTILAGLFGYPLKSVFHIVYRSYYALLLSSMTCGLLSYIAFQTLSGFTWLFGWPLIHTVLSIFLINLMIGMLGFTKKPRKKRAKKTSKAKSSDMKPIESSI